MRIITFILFCICLQVNGQTKKGGFFSRIDDPYNTYTRVYIPESTVANNEKGINYLDTFNIKTTFSVVNEYTSLHGDTLEPFLGVYPEKLTYLNRLLNKGHTLAMHTPNHSTNFYNVHVDSLSAADQTLLSGYTEADGVDTIVINNTNTYIDVAYWKRFNDDRYGFFGIGKIVDPGTDYDSIYYQRRIPPKTVHIAIFPSEAGLKKLITEQRRQFAASGLPEPDVWIHPGQEFEYTDYPLNLIESNGYITTEAGSDTVTYHTSEILSSNTYPIKFSNTYMSSIKIGDTKYIVTFVDVISDTVFRAKLTSYTGDGSNHDASLVPYVNYNWMWQVEETTMKSVAEELGLKQSATYPYGRQGFPLGYNSSTTNRQYFRWSHQWQHIILYQISAAAGIKKLVKAAARNYFVAMNDHEFLQGEQATVDSFYNFLNDHRDVFTVVNFADIQDSLYKDVDPYENILPSFDTDLNGDDVQDGWTLAGNTWTRDAGYNIKSDSTLVILSTTSVACDSLWGVEKGNNILSLYLSSTNADSCKIIITEYKHTSNTGYSYTTVRATTKYIKNLTSNLAQRLIVFNIDNTTDYIKVALAANRNNISCIKPELMLYNRRRQY